MREKEGERESVCEKEREGGREVGRERERREREKASANYYGEN